MSALYRKLGVATQSELVASYSMPPRPWPRDPSAAIEGDGPATQLGSGAPRTPTTPITPR